MNLSNALKLGLAKDIEKPERHIETWLSDIFLYKNVARKVTKYVSDKDFGDFTNYQERKSFYTADFSWNNLFAPEIYTDLKSMQKNKKDIWIPCDEIDAEDYYILMNRIDADDTLINRLYKKQVTEKDINRITRKLLVNLSIANDRYFKEQSRNVGSGVYKLMCSRLNNFKQFTLSAKGIPKEKTNARVDALTLFHKEHSYFKKINKERTSVTIDGHSANIVFIKNLPVFMDVYWPMPTFRIVDHVLAFARIAACIRVFMNDKLADNMYKIYQEERKLPPKEILDFYETYNSFVMGYYFTHIKRPEFVQSYFDFADKKLSNLKKTK